MKELRLTVEALTVYKLMVEEAPDMLCVLSADREGKVLYANLAFARLLGTAPDRVVGRGVWEVTHAEDKEEVLGAFSDTVFSRELVGKAKCRLRPLPLAMAGRGGREGGREGGYVKVELTLRKGTQGLVAIIRPESGGKEGGRAGSRPITI